MTREQIKRRLKVTRIKSVLPLGCPKGHGALLVCVSSPFPLLFWEHFSKDRSCRAGQQTTQLGSLLISLARTTTWFVWCILSVFFSACLWGQLSECHAANHRIFADKNNTVCFLVHTVYLLWCRLTAAHGSRVTTHLNTTILHTEEKRTWPNTHTHWPSHFNGKMKPWSHPKYNRPEGLPAQMMTGRASQSEKIITLQYVILLWIHLKMKLPKYRWKNCYFILF